MICPLCDREMVDGPTLDRHHLIPKSKGGKEQFSIHIVCHRKIHSVFTEKELARNYFTWEALRSHPDIAKFIRWVKRKHIEFVTSFDRMKEV